MPLLEGVITLFVLMNFSLATFMDPGVIPRASADEDRDDDFRAPLYRNVEINGITVGEREVSSLALGNRGLSYRFKDKQTCL